MICELKIKPQTGAKVLLHKYWTVSFKFSSKSSIKARYDEHEKINRLSIVLTQERRTFSNEGLSFKENGLNERPIEKKTPPF